MEHFDAPHIDSSIAKSDARIFQQAFGFNRLDVPSLQKHDDSYTDAHGDGSDPHTDVHSDIHRDHGDESPPPHTDSYADAHSDGQNPHSDVHLDRHGDENLTGFGGLEELINKRFEELIPQLTKRIDATIERQFTDLIKKLGSGPRK